MSNTKKPAPKPAAKKKPAAPKPMPSTARRALPAADAAAPPGKPAHLEFIGPAAPPGDRLPEFTYFESAPNGQKAPYRSMYHAVGKRVNAGIYAAAFALCEHTYRESSEDYPCDIHELAQKSHDFAEMVKAIRELYCVPGCREYLTSRRADARGDEYEPR